MKLALGFLFLLFSSATFAATLTTSSSCTLGDVTSVGTTSCSLGDLSDATGFAFARIDLSSTFASSPSQPLVVGIQTNVTTFAGFPSGGFAAAFSDTSGTYTLPIATAGPVRTGYVVFATSGSGTGSSDGFTGLWNLDLQRGSSLADVVGECGGNPYNCDGTAVTDPYWPFPTPVTLGTTLTLTATAYADAYQLPLDGGDGGGTSASISIQFFEANNQPVQILDASVPEPATWTLAALPLALLFWRFRKYGSCDQVAT